jgi:HK97 family phage major capsid protein
MELRDKILGERQFREAQIARDAVNSESRSVDLSFSSETPVVRWFGIEVLSHEPGAMRMNRMNSGANLLVDHDPSDVVGVIEECGCKPDEKKGRATARFGKSARASEILQDVGDGIRRNISVGYNVHDYREMKAEEMPAELVLLAANEKLPVLRVTDWEPMEISIVSIPADVSVGIGRSEGGEKLDAQIRQLVEAEVSNIKSQFTQGGSPMETPVRTEEEILKTERDRLAELEAIGQRFVGRVAKIDELKQEAIQKGWTPELFKGTIADRISDDKPIFTPETEIGLTPKEVRQYSLVNAIKCQLPEFREKMGRTFEHECHEELLKTAGRQVRGMLVPWEIQTRNIMVPQKRTDVSLATPGTTGAALVGTQLVPSSFIELLRNRMVAFQLGVRHLPGLVGNIAFPRQTVGGTFSWHAEGSAASESAQTYDQVTMHPNTGSGYSDITRVLILQATPAIEGLITEDLAKICALGLDLALFHGAGTTAPTGLVGQSCGSVTAAGCDWPAVVEFETDVASANADVATMAFAMTAAGRGLLKTRNISGDHPIMMIGPDGRLNGYPVFVTNQITAGYVFFGDWAQAIIGQWGGLEILVDPYTASTTGTVRIVAYIAADVCVRQPLAFSIASDLS